MIANLKEIARRIKAHNIAVISAGIAFYGLLALVPTLIALVSIYGMVPEPEDSKQQVADAAGSLDADTQSFVTGILEDIVSGQSSQVVGLIFGVVVALFSASGAVQKLIATISTAYEAAESRPGWKLRLMAYAFTTAAIVGVVLMALTIGASPALLERANLGQAAETAIGIAQIPVLAILFGGALTVLYRYGPDRAIPTPWRNPGAIVGTLLFISFAIAFSIYSANVGLMPASYGLLGSVAALMIFLQLTAIAVIVGAEVNAAVEVGALRTAAAQAGAVGQSVGVPQLTAGAVGTVDQPVMASPAVGGDDDGSKTLSFGKALAGLLALAALARGIRE